MSAPAPGPDLQDASAWFDRLRTHSVSSETLTAFRAWRRQPGNLEAYRKVERAWERAAMLEGDPDIRQAMRAALERRELRRRQNGLGGVGLGLTVAAAAAIAVALTWPEVMGRTYATEVGEQRVVQLADGSRVRLDTQTRLAVHLSRDRRLIRLAHGQALFDVAHDPARPFVVDAGGAAIQALGTRFDVRRDDDHLRVTLLQGRVQVRPSRPSAGPPVNLSPGQQVQANGVLGPVQKVDVAVATSWTTGRIILRDMPLSAAVAEVNRYSQRKISLRADRLASVEVSAAFDSGDIDAFAASVSDLYGLRVTPAAAGGLVLTDAETTPPR